MDHHFFYEQQIITIIMIEIPFLSIADFDSFYQNPHKQQTNKNIVKTLNALYFVMYYVI